MVIMAAHLATLMVLLAFAGQSNALYCICRDGMNDSTLQMTLGYACEYGANCTAILKNGPCYYLTTLQNHCSFAVNGIFQANAYCDYGGVATAITNRTMPFVGFTSTSSGCVYQSTPDWLTGYGTRATAMAPAGIKPSMFVYPEILPASETGAAMKVYRNLNSTLLWICTGLFILQMVQ